MKITLLLTNDITGIKDSDLDLWQTSSPQLPQEEMLLYLPNDSKCMTGPESSSVLFTP